MIPVSPCLLTFELCFWSEEWLLLLVKHAVAGPLVGSLVSYFALLTLGQYKEIKHCKLDTPIYFQWTCLKGSAEYKLCNHVLNCYATENMNKSIKTEWVKHVRRKYLLCYTFYFHSKIRSWHLNYRLHHYQIRER